MQVREITATWGGKINMGDYNSAHLELTASALLDPGEDESEAIAQLWQIVQESVRVEARKLAARRGARVDEIFAGLPVEAQQQINGGRKMAIIGLTDRPAAFPEIGVLRKGAPKPEKGNKPGEDLKYFRFDSADADAARLFTEHYGAEPVAIRVFVPLATAGENFEAWREEWTASSLKHRCDGQTMVRWLTPRGTYSDEPKPCTGGCKQVGRLKVVIPELRRFAYVTVLTTSIHDILQIHANLLALESLRGDLRGIPLILKRVPRKISTPNGNGERARREKWLITIEAAPSWVELQLTAQEQAALPQAQPLALPEWDGEDDEDGDASESPALADAKTAAAIETLWSQFGAKTTDKKAIYPLKSYLQEKKGVSSPSEMLAEDAKLLLGWLQGKALAVSDAQPVHQAEVVEERETVTV